MLQAIRLEGPRRVIPEDVADPSLLGTGEHGAAMVAERAGMGQRGRTYTGGLWFGDSAPPALASHS